MAVMENHMLEAQVVIVQNWDRERSLRSVFRPYLIIAKDPSL
jgi:hypothetical protein